MPANGGIMASRTLMILARSHTKQGRLALTILGLLTLIMTACAAPRNSTNVNESGAAPHPTKSLRIGTTKEPTTGLLLFNGGGTGQLNAPLTFHSSLTVLDSRGTLTPRIAEKIPTIDE